jgi:ethylmalonyl-CoA/methylmalonyl-CoA decarboxylase
MRISKSSLGLPLLATRYSSSAGSRGKAPLVEVHDQFLQLMVGVPSGSSSGRVVFGVDRRVATISLDNQKKRGAVDAKMFLELARAVDSVESLCESGEVGGIVLRGAGGGAFSAGLDLDLATQVLNTPSRGVGMCDFMTDLLNRVRDCAAVSVCLINGAAIGGGSELITCTDYRVMLAGARIQSVHARIGAAPGWGGTTRLAQLVGKREALRLLGSSHSLDAEEAHRIGLIDEIIPEGEDGDAAALRRLEPFLNSKQSSKSVEGIKYTLAAADEEEMMIREGEVFYERWFSTENQDAIKKARK